MNGEFKLQKRSVSKSVTRLDELNTFVKDNDPALILRLGFHSANTFDPNAIPNQQGGTEGATMRFRPESRDGQNGGLSVAIRRIDQFINTHEWANTFSIADLWTKASAVAISVCGGPTIDVESGRVDFPNNDPNRPLGVPPTGRLASPSMTLEELRANFERMGFNDKEMVVLSGGHTLGEAHRFISQHEGQWTKNNRLFTNDYFKNLLNETWTETTISNRGNRVSRQFRNADNTLMMLQSDIFLIQDPELRQYVELYANDQNQFFKDFSDAYARMLRNGCPVLKGKLKLDEEVVPSNPPPRNIICSKCMPSVSVFLQEWIDPSIDMGNKIYNNIFIGLIIVSIGLIVYLLIRHY